MIDYRSVTGLGELQGVTHLMLPSSPAVTPRFSPTQMTLLTVPSWAKPLVSSKKFGGASGRLMSKILAFFSWPPVMR